MNTYLVGNVVKVTALFQNENLILVDPAAVFLIVNCAGKVELTYQYGVGNNIVKAATGTYTSDLILDIVGGWNYYWFSSGSLSAENGQFLVEESGV
jgi:hypothetical protein